LDGWERVGRRSFGQPGGDPGFGGRPVVDPGMGQGRGGDFGGDLRLAHHMQAPDAGRMIRHRPMMFGQIVDEQGDAGLTLRDDGRQRPPLAALVPVNRE